ncbi:hypothetical protein KPL35_08900 [Clostridium sp. CF011]|uniref:hypothetical protein n=1 Tax=Clostridium sp. CF011 TaxID=2843318 RepID=UPI001C0E52EF|nr:hypothetical protein [Clostridium sp. CF011]MBU3092194.1 hypothetical protein [Clostridium sp. CF011]WAG70330.1 hypothetical protein LL036_02465 [Clostridium sp. CF011]
MINDFSESDNNNMLVQERCDAGDKIVISLRYNIPDDIKKEVFKIAKIDKGYINDTIEINKSF